MVVISGFPVGGAESVTARFLCHLARNGRPVPVCTVSDRHDGPPADHVARERVPRFDLGARRLLDPLALGRLVRLLQRERIDLLHAHGQDASILAAAASTIRPTDLAVTRHVLEEPAGDARERARAHLALAALRRADAVVAVSRAVARELGPSAGVPDERVHVIHNGVETDRYVPSRLERSREAIRRSLGLGEEDRVVLLPAVMREGKGHGRLLSVLPALRRRVPGLRVLLAGSGELEDELRREARHRGVGGVVRFLGFRSDIPELLAAADLVVLPSLSEALPTVLMEAAAAGRPVVATRVGGAPEIVRDGETGLLVPPDDPGALVQAVSGLLLDPDRAWRYGRSARTLAERRFDMRRQVDWTLELWKDVAGKGLEGGP